MSSYVERLEKVDVSDRWPMVRGWMREDPLSLYDELRIKTPILKLPEVTLVTRFDDCAEVLRRHDLFTVAPYRLKLGTYWMAQDNTAQHWREKSVMSAILDLEELPAMRHYISKMTAEILENAGGEIEAIRGLTRAVPVALVQDWFGYDGSDPDNLIRWSYWNTMDAFWNQPFDTGAGIAADKIIAEHDKCKKEMGLYLAALITRKALNFEALGGDDPVSRLLRLASTMSVKLDAERLAINVGGLLVCSVESASHASVNALCYLMEDPERLAWAREAAQNPDPTVLDGFIFESLRFRPIFPYFIRRCERDALLSRDTLHETTIHKGTTIFAVTHSAMFDDIGFKNPYIFDPERSQSNAFHFGLGLHECLGRGIGGVLIPEIVRKVLLLPNLVAGEVDRKGGPLPESWQLSWG